MLSALKVAAQCGFSVGDDHYRVDTSIPSESEFVDARIGSGGVIELYFRVDGDSPASPESAPEDEFVVFSKRRDAG